MADQQLAQLMRSRADMFNMLSRAFIREVDDVFLAELKGMRFPQNTGNADVDAAYRSLFDYLSKTPESVLDDLAVDYARAFLGSGTLDTTAAYPYESVYTSERGLLMQDARDEVLVIYRSEGLDKNLSWTEGEDHIALEMLFLRAIALRTAEAIEGDDEREAARLLLTQRNFATDHVMRWADRWANDVPKYTKLPFYPAFARLLVAYVSEDLQLLAELVGSESDPATEPEEA